MDSNTGNSPKGGGLKNIYESSKSVLNLSADQESQIENALQELKDERRSFKSSGDADKEELRKARKQARQKIIAVLTPEQKTIWQATVDKLHDDAD